MDVISYGATITVLKVPNKDGKPIDVVLGYTDLNGKFQKYSKIKTESKLRLNMRIDGLRFIVCSEIPIRSHFRVHYVSNFHSQ